MPKKQLHDSNRGSQLVPRGVEMREIVRRYSKDGVTVVWEPGLCVHSQVCIHGLSSVFDPRIRRWINMDGAAMEAIVEQVGRCPSGAISIAAVPEPREPQPGER